MNWYYSHQGTDLLLTEGEMVFGSANNELQLRAYLDPIEQTLEQQPGTGEVTYFRDTLMTVRYTDFMGNDRTEYYSVFLPRGRDGVIHNPKLFLKDREDAQSDLQQYDELRRQGIHMILSSERVTPGLVDLIARHVYDESRRYGPESTPADDTDE